MSSLAKGAREALKEKARRLAGGGDKKVDATSVKRPAAFTADKKAGLQPTTRRAFKKGGAVKKADGGPLPGPEEAARSEERMRGVRVESKEGTSRKLPPPGEAAARSGKAPQDVPARKSGGRAKKDLGGVLKAVSPLYAALDRSDEKKDADRSQRDMMAGAAMANANRKSGGRTAKKGGGGLTVINIGGKGGQQPQPGAPMAPPVAAPVPAAAPMAPAPAPVAPGQMPMQKPAGFKKGGRIAKVAASYKDMKAGAGSGEGREQKTSIAKKGKGAPKA